MSLKPILAIGLIAASLSACQSLDQHSADQLARHAFKNSFTTHNQYNFTGEMRLETTPPNAAASSASTSDATATASASAADAATRDYSNLAVSTVEDVATTGLLYLAYTNPVAAGVVALVLLVLAIILLVIAWRVLRKIFLRVRAEPAPPAAIEG